MSGSFRARAGFGSVTMVLVPAANFVLSLLLSAVVVLLVGENPVIALRMQAG